MNTQYIRLNMVPAGVLPVMHASQFDIGRPLGVVVYDGSAEMDLDDYTVTIEATRTDGTPITAAVATDGSIGAFVTTATMTNKDDLYPAQLVIVDGDSNRVASLPFMMRVVKAAMDENSEAIEEDVPLYQQYNAAIQALIVDVKSDLNAEAAARKAADTTLQNNINSEAATRAAADDALSGRISTEATTRANQDGVLQAQIDQLVAPTGSAPSAAEVENARVGADGVTYNTLGNAIRTQVTNVETDIHYVDDKVGLITNFGYDWSNTGNNITMTKAHNTLLINGNRSGSYGYYPLSEAYQMLTNISNYAGHSISLTAGKRYELVVILKSGSLNRTSGDTTIDVYDSNNHIVSTVYLDRNITAGVERTGGTFVAGNNNYSIILHTSNNQFANALYEIYIREYQHDELTETFYGVFVRGTLSDGVLTISYYYRAATDTIMVYDRDIYITVDNGYRYWICYYDSTDAFASNSGWITTDFIIPANTRFKVVIALTDETSRPYAYVPDYVKAVKVTTYTGQNTVNNEKLSNRLSVVENLFRFKRFYSHIGLNQNANDVIIPNQSVFDVTRTKRLGFDAMEFNVHKTSDNHYICIHGSSQKWGGFVESTDNTDISNVSISSYSLSDVKNTVRFKSKYDKYKIAPNTLEEVLYECKKQNIVPLVQYRDDAMVSILDSIMGKGNYALLLYSADRGIKTDAPCFGWLTLTDPDEIVAKCKTSGKTYYCALDVSNSVYSGFTDSDWVNLVSAVHAAGYPIGFVGLYTGEELSQKFFNYGFDFSGSGWDIPEIQNGNLCDLHADVDFTAFSTNGTTTNYNLVLATGQTIKPIFDDTQSDLHPEVFMGGGCLHIRFNGTVQVVLGKYIYQEYTSDGSTETIFSSMFEEEWPGFVVTASTSTTVYEISYAASIM